MSDVLIITETVEGVLRKVSFEMASQGYQLAKGSGGTVDGLVLGEKAGENGELLLKYGVTNAFYNEDAKTKVYGADLYSQIVMNLIKEKQYGIILLAASLKGKDLAAVLAAKLNTGLATDCVDLKPDGDRVIFKRPIYSGKAYANVKIKSDPQIATIRPNTLEAKEQSAGGALKKIECPDVTERVKVIELKTEKSDRIDATEAPVVISGGRGMKSPEAFKILEELADLLGAGIGASRAATDAGWIPYQYQIGQTGKVVAPNVYLACGISGAIQHMAGMSSSKYIVAVNKDPEAPIFKSATFGIIHDLHEFIPAFTAVVKKNR
jgi:electron transfer flavoprotein alpha subunit